MLKVGVWKISEKCLICTKILRLSNWVMLSFLHLNLNGTEYSCLSKRKKKRSLTAARLKYLNQHRVLSSEIFPSSSKTVIDPHLFLMFHSSLCPCVCTLSTWGIITTDVFWINLLIWHRVLFRENNMLLVWFTWLLWPCLSSMSSSAQNRKRMKLYSFNWTEGVWVILGACL